MALELAVSDGYVDSWGVWEGVREFLQNAKDADDDGYSMTVKFRKSRGGLGTLVLRNNGATMGRETLLMGVSGKRGTGARGRFGEGYKVAALALVRLGLTVKIRTRQEVWEFSIVDSETFNGARSLHVRTHKIKDDGGLTVEIGNFAAEDWDGIRERALFLSSVRGAYVGTNGILYDNKYRGMLFSRGLFVMKMRGDYKFGWDLGGLELNRDRTFAQEWKIESEIKSVLEGLVTIGSAKLPMVETILKSGGKEAEALANGFARSPNVDKIVAEAFLSEFGQDAVPVSSVQDAMKAERVGLRPVSVTQEHKRVLERKIGTISDRLEDRGQDVRDRVGLDKLGQSERESLLFALEQTKAVRDGYGDPPVQVVEFYNDKIVGMCNGSEVLIARKVLKSKVDTLAVMVHETCHMDGSKDGSVGHRNVVERALAEIAVKALGA